MPIRDRVAEHDLEKHALDLIRGWYQFSEKIMLQVTLRVFE